MFTCLMTTQHLPSARYQFYYFINTNSLSLHQNPVREVWLLFHCGEDAEALRGENASKAHSWKVSTACLCLWPSRWATPTIKQQESKRDPRDEGNLPALSRNRLPCNEVNVLFFNLSKQQSQKNHDHSITAMETGMSARPERSRWI